MSAIYRIRYIDLREPSHGVYSSVEDARAAALAASARTLRPASSQYGRVGVHGDAIPVEVLESIQGRRRRIDCVDASY